MAKLNLGLSFWNPIPKRWFMSYLSCFGLSFLLLYLGRQQKMLSLLGILPLIWKTRMGFLAALWPNHDCCGHLGGEPVDARAFFSLIFALHYLMIIDNQCDQDLSLPCGQAHTISDTKLSMASYLEQISILTISGGTKCRIKTDMAKFQLLLEGLQRRGFLVVKIQKCIQSIFKVNYLQYNELDFKNVPFSFPRRCSDIHF